jgi:Flp pilus assembly protein TadG
MTPILNRTRRRRGSAVLDMALVFPVLIMLAFGVVEYGYYFYVKHNAQAASREGARAAVVAGAKSADVTVAVANVMAATGLDKTGYTVTVTDTAGTPINFSTVVSGTPIKVLVQFNWGAVGVHPLPEILGGMSPTRPVKGATVMRREG